MQSKDAITGLERLLDSGQDNALIRFGLGNAYLDQEDTLQAIEHLQRAVELDESYSAAWKVLGKAYHAAGDDDRARETYRRGIAIAEARGDRQAAREMGVFLRRLEKRGD